METAEGGVAFDIYYQLGTFSVNDERVCGR